MCGGVRRVEILCSLPTTARVNNSLFRVQERKNFNLRTALKISHEIAVKRQTSYQTDKQTKRIFCE